MTTYSLNLDRFIRHIRGYYIFELLANSVGHDLRMQFCFISVVPIMKVLTKYLVTLSKHFTTKIRETMPIKS